MEKESILEKIISKYTLQNIFDYVKEENFKFKLFVYSKKLQKKLDLKLFDYQNIYLKNRINLFDFLSDYNKKEEGYPKNYDKKGLTNKFSSTLNKLKLKEENITDYIINFFKNYEKKENDEIYIDFYSPFFDLLSKEEYFWKKFIIPISSQFINKNDLKNDYKSFFNKINKLNINYSLLFLYINENNINYLKELGINFNQIKKFIASPTDSSEIIMVDNKKDFNDFLKILFSFDNINNLNYLKIHISGNQHRIKLNIIESLNNFKCLEYLYLAGIDLESTFIINLPNLKKLGISGCDKITFFDNPNLEQLYINESGIDNPKSLLKFPKLEKCEFYSWRDTDIKRYNSIIDLSILGNLKIFAGEAQDFLKLDNVSLESCSILSNYDSNIEIEKEVIEKIISIKSLKNVRLILKKINSDEISKIQGENNSINKLEINFKENKNDLNILNFQNKLINLSELKIILPFVNNTRASTNLKIEENLNCKVNTIEINGDSKNIILYCGPYENLVKVDIYINCDIVNYKTIFPIFDNNCKTIFKSLNYFKLIHNSFGYNVSLDILNNIYNNIDKMPKLKYFEMYCFSKDIDESFYNKLNKKIMSLNLEFIKIEIVKDLFGRKKYVINSNK